MNLKLLSVLADVTVILHATFVLFVVLGQGLILLGWLRQWQWVRYFPFRGLHLLAISYVVLEAWLGLTCPLTTLENYLRSQAGEIGYGHSFIGYWVHYLLFYSAPEWVFTLVYSIFGSLVVLTFLAYPPRVKS